MEFGTSVFSSVYGVQDASLFVSVWSSGRQVRQRTWKTKFSHFGPIFIQVGQNSGFAKPLFRGGGAKLPMRPKAISLGWDEKLIARAAVVLAGIFIVYFWTKRTVTSGRNDPLMSVSLNKRTAAEHIPHHGAIPSPFIRAYIHFPRSFHHCTRRRASNTPDPVQHHIQHRTGFGRVLPGDQWRNPRLLRRG